MKIPLCALLAIICAFLTSCATLEHQTSAADPHAIVRVERKSELAKASVASIDGLSVKAGSAYRLRPGAHTVEIEYKKTTTRHGNHYGFSPSAPADVHIDADGRVSSSGGDPFGMTHQPINLSMDERKFYRKSLPFHVKAGKRYRMTDNLISPCQLIKR